MNVADEVQDVRETPCPRCGERADASFATHEAARVEISCPNCGLFELPREEFDQAVAELAELDDQR